MTANQPDEPSAVHTVGRRKATIVNLIFSYGTLALSVVHGLLMVPLYVRYIDIKLYGAWLASGNVLYWTAVAQGGTTYLLGQRSAHLFGERRLVALGENVGSGLFLLAALSTVAAAIAGVLAPFVPGWFQIVGAEAIQLEWAFIAAIAAMWLRLLCMGLTAIEQGYQRPLGVGVINIVTGIIHLIITVVLLLLGWGVLAIPVGTLIREVLCTAALGVHLAYTNRRIGVKLSITRNAIRDLRGLSVWTFFTFLNEAIDNGTMLLLVGVLLGTENVTVLTVSRASWEILIVVLLRFVVSVQPGLAHLNGEGNRESVIKVSNQMMLTVFGGLAVGMAGIWALNAPFVAIWGKPDLYAGNTFTALYTFGALFSVLTVGVSQVVLSLNAIRLSSVVQTVLNTLRIIIVAALLVPMNVKAVPVGAAVSLVLLGWLLLRNWQDIVLHSRIIPWNALLRGVRLLIAAGIVGWTGSVFLHPTNWIELTLSALAVVAVIVPVVFLLERSLGDVAMQVLRILRPGKKTKLSVQNEF